MIKKPKLKIKIINMNKHCQVLLFVVCILLFYGFENLVEAKQKSNLKMMKTVPLLIQQINNYTSNDSYVILNTCNNETCNSKYGYCEGESLCRCKFNYANFIEGDNSNNTNGINYIFSACTYERKKLSIALTLEMLLPFGFSSFYLGKKQKALMKVGLLVFLPLILLSIFCFCCRSDNSNKGQVHNALFKCFCVLYIVSFIIWFLVDLFEIVSENVLDANGIKLVH